MSNQSAQKFRDSLSSDNSREVKFPPCGLVKLHCWQLIKIFKGHLVMCRDIFHCHTCRRCCWPWQSYKRCITFFITRNSPHNKEHYPAFSVRWETILRSGNISCLISQQQGYHSHQQWQPSSMNCEPWGNSGKAKTIIHLAAKFTVATPDGEPWGNSVWSTDTTWVEVPYT